MNISELARKLKVDPEVLRTKLPSLGFDIGARAIKVDEQVAQQIVRAWNANRFKEREEADYLKFKNKDEKAEKVAGPMLIPPVLTVRDFAQLLNKPLADVIRELMRNGVMATLNQRIDYDTAAIIAEDLGYTPTLQVVDETVELDKDKKMREVLTKEDVDRMPRPPVVVVMGHVDHGKTKLLDAIRNTNVVAGEAGGITQHIGAYQIVKQDRLITFIDTPGHEAFSAMRSRGAKVADIAILVVAANDSVKPQTIEAIKIANAAGLPIVVAINKTDLPEANIEKTKQDLATQNLLVEEWGGKTPCVPISAKMNKNIDLLLETVLLVADVEAEKLKANPNGEIIAAVIESHMDKGVGPVATLLVKNGTLHQGDQLMVDGQFYGRIRLMRDYVGKEIAAATPSTPVQVTGLKVAPQVGDVVEVSTDKVKKVKSYKLEHHEETFVHHGQEENNEAATKLHIVLRTDVLGSQEAILESLEKLQNADVTIKFVQKGLGSINEGDVLAAQGNDAMLLGFNVLPTGAAQRLAGDKQVTIKTFKIIYELIDAVKEKLNQLIKPEIVREDLGTAKVIKVFKTEARMMILGCRVLTGKIEANSMAAVLRETNFIERGAITSLQVGKQVVKDVMPGQECGISFSGDPAIVEGDILEVYKEKEIKKFI